MKKLIIFISAAALALGLCGCGSGEYETGGDGLHIIATSFPGFDFAREIAGERANVRLLIPPGSESHSFEPTAQDILRIQNCDLLICNGGESEVWLEEVLEGMDGEVPTLVMLECVNALEEETREGMQTTEEHHHDHGDEEHDHEEHEVEYDEHVWTSPVNAALICDEICRRLCETDSAGADYYEADLAGYKAKLSELDAAFRDVVANAGCRTVIFADRFPARYFVEEYGLEYYAAFPGCTEDAEPSARTVAFLIDKVNEEHTPAVFYIEFSNRKMANIISEDTGCKTLLFHTCHNVSAQELDEGVSYLKLMTGNIETLREALG